MKKLFNYLLVCFVCVSCSKKQSFTSIETEITKTLADKKGDLKNGKVVLQVTENNELMLLQSSDPNTPNQVDRIIILAFDKGINIPIKDQDLKTTSMFFFSDKRAIALHSEIENKVFLVGLNEQESQEKKDLLNLNLLIKDSYTETLLGYGISVLTGKWDLEKLTTNKFSSAFDKLDYSNQLMNIVPLTGGGGGAPNCTSGGAGASECSIEETIGGKCSVTCQAGYYACCDSRTVKCNCVKNPAN